ncbi:MAG TPA: response regulator transcription factor [Chthoniobacterales bacterium]
MKGPESNSKQIRVLIVDDHPMTRDGLSYLINHQADMMVCCEARNAAEALDGVIRFKPDLVLADYALPDKNGLELIKDIRAIRPDLPLLIISMHEESMYADRVLRAGARGYISKEEGGKKLMEAIRHVLSGRIYVSDEMSARILEIFSGGQAVAGRSGVEELTDREFEIFGWIGDGLSTQEIAKRLHLSAKTVDAHRANIKEKLKLKTINELVSYAARWTAIRGGFRPDGCASA